MTAQNPKIDLKLGNSAEVLRRSRRKFDLILTSPGYNVEKEYEEKQSLESYLEEQKEVIIRAVSLLSDQGSVCWQVGNYINKKTNELYPLDIFYYGIFKELGLTLRNRIIWTFGHGFHAKHKFSGRYETILWFTKSDRYIFNLDDVRVPSKYPGKTHYKGDKKGEISGNPKGKNPSDVWRIVKNDWETGVWEIPNVKANHSEKTEHPCQFPIELAERCILALTNNESWILDPYAGVCTTPVAALKNGRNCLAIELNKKYLEIGKNRLKLYKNNELKYRPLGKPIFEPNNNMAVAKKPEYFEY